MAQHWVPQYVLRGFSADGKTICQYDKMGEIAAAKVGLKGACGRNDAFLPPVERLLSTIENAANPAIAAFRSMARTTRIDPVAKRIVAIYLSTFLWKRSPAARDQQVAETKEADLLDWAHQEVKLYGLRRNLYRDLVPAVAAKAAADVNRLMAGHWESATFQRWLFYSMSWAVLRSKEPIVTVPDRGLVRLGDRGLLDPKAELYFPLNSKRVLLVSWHGSPPDVVQLLSESPAHMRSINKLGFGQAGRFVYAQEHSDKVAAVVQRSTHYIPTLRALHVSGGPNPTAGKLDSLSAWYERVANDHSDNPDRHWCMAPGARDQFRHNWQRAPFKLAVATQPGIEVPVSVCEWCCARELQYANGHIDFDDLELQRTTVTETMKNWWQSFNVVATQSRIEARGAMPRYRLTKP